MTFTVKQGKYKQRSERKGKSIQSIHLGKVDGTQGTRRPTQLDHIAPETREKILSLYQSGYGDKKIARILHEEDQIGDKPIGYNVIRTYRIREGVPDRVKEPKPEPENWRAIADEQSVTIDELKRLLVASTREKEILSGKLHSCREQNYALRFPGV